MYNGGKNGEGVYQTIINQIPPHDIYIEPFLGSGSIIKNKRPALFNIGVELDAAVIDKFHYDADYKVINGCGISYISAEWISLTKDVFIYCDPPYPFSTRRSGSYRHLYKYEFTDEQHSDLLKVLLSMKANIAISSYPNDVYDALLKGWRTLDFQAMTRKGLATERLYMNYPDPIALHDYSFLGNNFTERQRIKRKIQRQVKKLAQLPQLEKMAIIDAIRSSIV